MKNIGKRTPGKGITFNWMVKKVNERKKNPKGNERWVASKQRPYKKGRKERPL